MTAARLRLSFIVFHLTLGLGLLYASVRTVLGAAHGGGHAAEHIAGLGAIEAIGAVLFLIPRTLRLGATLLLATIAVAILMHAAQGGVRADLLIYAAGVWFVLVHGSAWAPSSASSTPPGATHGPDAA